MIYSVDQIQHLHLEISSLCNAACPLCPRNFWGYEYNAGYKEHNMTLAEAQKRFSIEFVKQLRHLVINGNFGDAVMNPDPVPIVNYLNLIIPGCISISAPMVPQEMQNFGKPWQLRELKLLFVLMA